MGCKASLVVFYKSPTEVLDYKVDWSPWLGSDDIDTSAWDVPTGITKNSDNNTTKDATIWLSGGTLSSSYVLGNTVVTVGGRTVKREFTVEIIDR